MKYIIIFLLLINLSTFSENDNDHIYLKSYSVDHNAMLKIIEDYLSKGQEISDIKNPEVFKPNPYKDFFKAWGVEFSAECDLTYSCSKLYLTSNNKGHELIKRLLNKLCLKKVQIQIEYNIIRFSTSNLNSAGHKTSNLSAISDEVKRLWSTGAGEVLYSLTSISKEGETSEMRSVDEIIIPSEYMKNCLNGNVTNLINLQTREVGHVVVIIATIDDDDETINITFSAENSSNIEPELRLQLTSSTNNFSSSSTTHFHSSTCHVISTKVSIKDGNTLILGGYKTKDNHYIDYIFLTAWIVNTDGSIRSCNSD